MEYTDRLTKVYQLFVESPEETVPLEEIHSLFFHAGFTLCDEELANIKKSCPEKGLPFSQYMNICEDLEKKEITRDELAKCLESISTDGSGNVDANTLINTLSTGSYALDEYEMAEMLRLMNPDANGKVSIVYLMSLIFNKEC
ncbi:hypothetical protein P3W45_001518 [Vairimorpha bombi]|jgi:calmodulin